MSAFTESVLIKKLGDLNSSSQSIQTLSLWLIHHRKHNEKIVSIWYKELTKGNSLNCPIYSSLIPINHPNFSSTNSKTRIHVFS